MKYIIGRKEEKSILEQALVSREAELIAVYGRRRVGKTYLVRNTYQKNLIFEFSGVHNASLKEQLLNFRNALAEAMKLPVSPAVPENWTEAFLMLKNYTKPLLAKKKCVIFIDELPWLSSPRSGFLQAFEYFWNSWGTKQPNLILAICGSAASWMIQKVVNSKGGLHNRITRKIRLLPFTLAETEEYLKSNHVNLDHYQITQLYMALGGIPHYLREIKPGKSAAQNIDRICFSKDGALQGEFTNLYQSLFTEADRHISIIRTLATKPTGMTRQEIIRECDLSSGGGSTLLIEELLESGFITGYVPFQKSVRDTIYKLSDEYSRFYLKFVENRRATGSGTWIKLSVTPSWRSWSGTAFESVCLKHTAEIKAALGISGVYSEESAWRYSAQKGEKGCQIDLLIDRQDYCITLCEMKFSSSEFTIDKKYAEELQNKVRVFKSRTKTPKTLFVAMVTMFGVKENAYRTGLIQNEVRIGDLFK